jgi:DNA-binding transcriptional regulator GbsR (MarR family)
MRKDHERFVERAGLLWEADGLPRIAGRIVGLMIIAEEPLSLDEIADALGVSKASASTDTRLLERLGYLERMSKPGDRKDYYCSSEKSFEGGLVERVKRVRQFEQLIRDGRQLAVAPAVRERLADYQFVFKHITRALESTLDGLRKRHSKHPVQP